MSPREFEKLVERIDLNRDGAINFDEFAASLVDWQQVRDESSPCRLSLHSAVSSRHVVPAVARASAPGCSGREPFCELCKQPAPQGSTVTRCSPAGLIRGLPELAQLQDDNLWAKWIDVAFSKMDANGDGFISVDEIVSHMPEGASSNESARLNAISKVS